MARILVTGASGLLGSNLILQISRRHELTAVAHTHPIQLANVKVITTDLSLPENVTEIIHEASPEWVIHCAAETNVDRCEKDPERAFRLNRDMASWVAQATRGSGGRLIFISTDAVFDGSRNGWREEDVPEPINVYGRSKLEGERAVMEEDPDTMIIRTNFFGWNAQDKVGLAEWFLSHLEMGNHCRGFKDIFVKLVLVNELVKILLRMIERRCVGIYHVVGRECISKYDFGVQLAKVFQLDPNLIQPIEVAQSGLEAPRARNLCLDTSKIQSKLDTQMPSLEDGLREFYTLRQTGYRESLKSLIGEQSHERN